MRLTHDEYYLKMLEIVAARSTCVRRAVGAILVDEKYKVLSTGYNGVPSGFDHCTDVPCLGAQDPPGDSRRCMAIHGEVNVVVQCTRLDLARTLYVSCTPCFTCAKMLCNTPVKRIVSPEEYGESDGLDTLRRAGIKLSGCI